MDRFDRYWIGIVVGLVLPAAFGLTYIEVMHLWYALRTVFYTTDTWRLAKGVLIGALPYILASLMVSM